MKALGDEGACAAIVRRGREKEGNFFLFLWHADI